MSLEPRIAAFEYRVFSRWTRVANDVLGTLSFTLGMAAVSTEAPRFFALLCMVFVAVVGFRLQEPYQRIFRLWREIKHPRIQIQVVWRHYAVFLIGWLFLGFIALGLVTKNELSL